ncbi:MAG: hypothetical protein AABX14_00270 [Candidatus Aenigmatarchaeota archaeon]
MSRPRHSIDNSVKDIESLPSAYDNCMLSFVSKTNGRVLCNIERRQRTTTYPYSWMVTAPEDAFYKTRDEAVRTNNEVTVRCLKEQMGAYEKTLRGSA